MADGSFSARMTVRTRSSNPRALCNIAKSLGRTRFTFGVVARMVDPVDEINGCIAAFERRLDRRRFFNIEIHPTRSVRPAAVACRTAHLPVGFGEGRIEVPPDEPRRPD
ncbi:MAG: hypothetical protein OER77_13220 [Myxococcales bacterium]|nr:hypothetical protein [Myxococcales bacterium]